MKNCLSSRSLLCKPELWLFIASLSVQLVVLIGFSNTPYFLPASDDPKFYNEWALRIAKGQWTDGRAFYGLPGYAYALAGIYSITGFDPFLVGLIQSVMMAAIAVLILRISRVVFAPAPSEQPGPFEQWRPIAIGIAAALGWIFFRPANVFSVILMPTIGLVLIYWICVRWVATVRAPNLWHPWFAMGLCAGFVAMFVATILFVVPLMLCAIGITADRGSSVRAQFSRITIAAMILFSGLLIGTSPAWIHNYFIARDPVLLSGHSGLNFFMGNNGDATGYPKMPPGLRASQEGLLKDSIRVPELEAGRQLTRAEISKYWSNKASAWIRDHPADWIRLLGIKFRNAWNGFQYDDIGAIAVFRSQGILPPGFGFGAIAVLGLPGLLWAALRVPRARWVSGAVLLHFAALMPVFITERYRLAAVPGLLLVGAFWVWQCGCWVASRNWKLTSVWVLVTGASLWFVTIPQTDPRVLMLDDHNLGVRALGVGDLTTAENALLRAHKLGPQSVETNFALGNLWLAKGDIDRATHAYQITLSLNPRHSGALSNWGVIAMQQESWWQAEQLLRDSLTMEPENPRIHFLLATMLYECGRFDEARHSLTQALRYRPGQQQFLELEKKLNQALPKGEQ